MGLGLHGGGVGAAKFFFKEGAEVLITDTKTRSQLKKSLTMLRGLPLNFVLGKHRKKDFIGADLIIKNPAVSNDSPYLKIAKKHNILVKTDIEVFFDLVPSKQIIGITGSKGKSTTATLSYLFLKSKYTNVILAGNIGISALEVFPSINKKTKVILELSSFELEDLHKSPHIAVITSLFPDHLNRYKNFREYVKSKEAIFKYQKKNDILVLNYNSREAKKIASKAISKIYFFTSDFFQEWKIDFSNNKKNSSKQYRIKGIKDSNLSAALTVAEIFNIPERNVKKVLSDFKGLPHRQELVALKKGVEYINDSAATTPQSAMLAIDTFKNRPGNQRIILIAGGVDKGLDYKDFTEKIKSDVSCLFLFPGTASEKIKKEIKKFNNFFPVKSMKEAVEKASKRARKGDTVLLSPGAASFNLFENEFDRGKQFVKYVQRKN